MKKSKLLNIPIVDKFLSWSKAFVFPGFDGVPLYDVAVFFIKSFQGGTLSTRGAAIAFNFFMALFPSIIFLFTLIPYIPIDNFQDFLINQLETVLPKEAYELSKETILDIINKPRGGLASFGFISALIFSTNGLNALMEAFNQSSLAHDKHSWWYQRSIALLLVIIITSLTLVGISLIIFNDLTMSYLTENNILIGGFNIFLVQLFRWVIIVALFYFVIAFIYFFAPGIKSKKWKFFSAGSTVTTGLIILSSVGFSYYINNFGQYNKLYGSIGTILVIMLWLNLIATFLIIGYELNSSISNAKIKMNN